MPKPAYRVLVGAGIVAGAVVGAIWYLRRPRTITAPISPPTPDEQPKLERPAAPPVVLTDARVATWHASAMVEQAILTIMGTRLLLEGPSTARLRLDPTMDVTLTLRIGNGTDHDQDVVAEAELTDAATGALVASFWVSGSRRVQVRVAPHQVATVEWVTIRPAEGQPPERDLQLVVALSSRGRTWRYMGTILRTEAMLFAETPPAGQGDRILVSPPGRWEALERM